MTWILESNLQQAVETVPGRVEYRWLEHAAMTQSAFAPTPTRG
jgi:hypothetical protein